jgi:hypothetical protein
MWRKRTERLSHKKCTSQGHALRPLADIKTAVFAGKDASRALGLMSTKEADAVPEWKDLDDKEKKVLDDWVTYFSKRYNIVGRVEGATNTE